MPAHRRAEPIDHDLLGEFAVVGDHPPQLGHRLVVGHHRLAEPVDRRSREFADDRGRQTLHRFGGGVGQSQQRPHVFDGLRGSADDPCQRGVRQDYPAGCDLGQAEVTESFGLVAVRIDVDRCRLGGGGAPEDRVVHAEHVGEVVPLAHARDELGDVRGAEAALQQTGDGAQLRQVLIAVVRGAAPPLRRVEEPALAVGADVARAHA
ncbi:hypothetical protein MARA_58640 [Mycolicibacterium arabiense]|uniref:Uncharacterized protein n=1 Tax=Mycolicibacterium arabiense TaxID=1286181 RepID=A0A7I7S866_9MYCO|nr:hypothetical protein MARA_58640 [Mycolicibacterium arabiense]